MNKTLWMAALVVVVFAAATVALVDYSRRQPESTLGRSFCGGPEAAVQAAPGAGVVVGFDPPRAADDPDHLPRMLDELQVVSAGPTAVAPAEATPGGFAADRAETGPTPDAEAPNGVQTAAPLKLEFSIALAPKGADGKRSLSIGLGLSCRKQPAASPCSDLADSASCRSNCCRGAVAEPVAAASALASPNADPSVITSSATARLSGLHVLPANAVAEGMPWPATFALDTAAAAESLVARFYQVDDLQHDELASIIVRMVAPQSWYGTGGQGDIAYFGPGRTLIVRQTAQVHAEIETFLRQLREQAARPRLPAFPEPLAAPPAEAPARPRAEAPQGHPNFESRSSEKTEPDRYELILPDEAGKVQFELPTRSPADSRASDHRRLPGERAAVTQSGSQVLFPLTWRWFESRPRSDDTGGLAPTPRP
jgi:hypothetical protein